MGWSPIMTQYVMVLSTRVKSTYEIGTLFGSGGIIVKNNGFFRKRGLLEELGLLGGVDDIVVVKRRTRFLGEVKGLQKGGGDRSGVN